MASNTRMATAIQILCVIAYKGAPGTTAEVISRSLRTNPVVVRRLLKCMERGGLVAIRPGKDGGVQLGRTPGRITLEQVFRAVEEDTDVFALRSTGNPGCAVASRMTDLLTPIFGATNEAVARVLRRATLASLTRAIS